LAHPSVGPDGPSAIISIAARQEALGQDTLLARDLWVNAFKDSGAQKLRDEIPYTAWPLAKQMGLLDLNLKKLLEELHMRGKLPAEQEEAARTLAFYSASDRPALVETWQTFIRENFPLTVFALDPQVEEQNVYDAFSRRRMLQLALAINIAKGNI